MIPTLLPTLAALLGHWRRHPLELATLLVGLAVATALFSGVQALNAEARDSYARAARLLGAERTAQIIPTASPRIALADYVALRRAGWTVSPVIEGDLRRGADSLRLVGVDILTLPPGTLAADTGEAAAFLLPPYVALTAPATVHRLAGATDLPPRRESDAVPPDTLVLDIAEAARLLGTPDPARLLVAPGDGARPLPPDLAPRLALRRPEARSDLDRLTDSFHLNLTAFGLLSFLVGLFIVYAAIGLAFEQRRPTFRTLRAIGVSARALAAAMALEMLALALLGGLAGIAAGYVLAAALLPDVAASLRGLYGARVAGTLTLAPAWWASGLVMSLAGALAAAGTSLWRAVTLPLLAPAQPQAWLAAQRRSLRLQLALAALMALAALAALAFGRTLVAGFAVLAGLLLAAALALPALLAALLALPALLAALLALGGRRAHHPIAAWAWADTRQELGGLSLALMALLLALAVNVGVGTMVGSFRSTFTAYLDQRLAAELYVTARDDAEAAAIARWLAARPEVAAVLPIRDAAARLDGRPVELYGFTDHPTYRDRWPLLAALPGAWDRVAAGDAALVSEQTSRRLALAPGDRLTLPTPTGPWPLTVAGIYPDYGNVEAQLMLPAEALAARLPDLEDRRLAVRAEPAATPRLAADLRAAFDLAPGQAVDQSGLKAASLAIFDKTFAVTVALNALTFTVAGIALLASLLTLADARLPRLAPVWASGVTRRRLALLELARATGLAALTALFALPLGLALAWVLTAVVNVRAFGWRLPVLLFPGQWATLFALALATAALAAAWPALRLRRTSPLRLLQGFSNER